MDSSTNAPRAQHIAILLPSLAGGGAERSMLNLARSFSQQGRKVDLLLFRPEGAYINDVPELVRVIELKAGNSLSGRLLTARADPAGISTLLKPVLLPLKADSSIRHIHTLKQYMEMQQPDIILSALTYTNLAVLWAKQLSRVKVPVVVSERIALSMHRRSDKRQHRWRWRFMLPMVKRTYRFADGIVAVSDSVANDLHRNVQIDRGSITTIYNPVVDDMLSKLAAQPLNHPWFEPGQPPVILGVGRLIPQKDFQTLLRAFATLHEKKKIRLVILGEGRQRAELTELAQKLGVENDVDMPGFVDNPYQYMAHASVFILTSLYEGLPGVLIQALACGCPVISTNCPGGSAEILDNGKYGYLVPVQHNEKLVNAIHSTLLTPPSREQLKARAALFSTSTAAQQYLDLLDKIIPCTGSETTLAGKYSPT
ncbi:Glycosyl transferase, group 1 [hydrothermal vent metagenome]|uniref:Glycosyl transferase, group 1 n=1 Tax=hydrothermal vent metagenome TaxID=652676 RepID=A0A3B0YG92_9ZZZZ